MPHIVILVRPHWGFGRFSVPTGTLARRQGVIKPLSTLDVAGPSWLSDGDLVSRWLLLPDLVNIPRSILHGYFNPLVLLGINGKIY